MNGYFEQEGLVGEQQGYARIVLQAEPGDVNNFSPQDGIAVGMFTGSTTEFLHPRGKGQWDGSPRALQMETSPVVDGDKITFLLQPAYVDELKDGTYDVYLLGKDGQEKERTTVFFENIRYSPLRGKNVVAGYEEREGTDEEPDEGQDDAESEAAPVTDSAPSADSATEKAESVAAPESGQEVEQAAAPVTQPAVQPEQPASDEVVRPPAQPKSKAGLWVVIGVLLLALAGGGGYFYYGKMKAASEEQAKIEEAERQAAEEAAKAEAERKAAEEAAKAEAERKAAEEAAKAEAERKAAEEAARADTRARVASFFAGERTPEGAMKLAEEVDKDTPEQKDAVFRLYYYAAQNGSEEGAKKYAETLDPTTPGWGSIKKDGAEAWQYYGKSGNAEAQARVKKWVEEQAGRGNSAARSWLPNME